MSPASPPPAPHTIHLVHVVADLTLPLVVHGWVLGRHRYQATDGTTLEAVIVRERTGGYAARLTRYASVRAHPSARLQSSAGRFDAATTLVAWLEACEDAEATWRTWWRHVLEQTEAALSPTSLP